MEAFILALAIAITAILAYSDAGCQKPKKTPKVIEKIFKKK